MGEAWDAGLIPDGTAALAWLLLAARVSAFHPKPDVRLNFPKRAANDPKRSLSESFPVGPT